VSSASRRVGFAETRCGERDRGAGFTGDATVDGGGDRAATRRGAGGGSVRWVTPEGMAGMSCGGTGAESTGGSACRGMRLRVSTGS